MTYQERAAEFKKTHPDFEELLNRNDILLPAEIVELIAMQENGPRIAYFLGTNPEFARSLSKMRIHHAAFEIGRLAVNLEGLD